MTNNVPDLDLPGATDALNAAAYLAAHNDRYAFFATLIVGAVIIGMGAIWVGKYFVRQNQELVNALTLAHRTHAEELKGIVNKLDGTLAAATEARVEQTLFLREANTAMREASDELRLARAARTAASPLGKG